MNGEPMETQMDRIFTDFEAGRISRRQLVMGLGSLLALTAAARRLTGDEAPAETTPAGKAAGLFEATELNHIALRVTDVPRSRDFYIQHLGMQLSREGGNNAFLTCGKNFVALFQGSEAGLDHYCYSVKGYDADTAEETLRSAGLSDIRRSGNRIYFSDPDKLTVQLAAEQHLPS